jgi:hypothetical protein
MPTLAQQWIEEGKQQALLNSILDLLRVRFDASPVGLTERLSAIEEPETLSLILRQAAMAESLADFESYLDSL